MPQLGPLNVPKGKERSLILIRQKQKSPTSRRGILQVSRQLNYLQFADLRSWQLRSQYYFAATDAGAAAFLATTFLSAGFLATTFLAVAFLTAGFLVRNLGFLTKDYLDDRNSKLPLDVQLGLTYKPEFMPFRFSLTARNLNRSDVVYYDAANNTLLGGDDEPGFSQALFQRLVFGSELLLSQNFQVRLGYNHQIRQDLKNQNGVNGGAGFSFGFMFRTKRFEFAFSRALYHAAGGSNTFQVNIDLNGLIKKKTND